MGSCSISHQTRTAGQVLGTLIRVSFQNNSSTKESVCVCVCVCSVTQSCPTLCDPVDCSPPASSVHGILQARILEWGGAISSSGDFPNPGIKPTSLLSLTLASGFFTTSASWEDPPAFTSIKNFSDSPGLFHQTWIPPTEGWKSCPQLGSFSGFSLHVQRVFVL